MQKFVVRVNKTTLEAPVYVNVQTSFVLRLRSIKLEKACYIPLKSKNVQMNSNSSTLFLLYFIVIKILLQSSHIVLIFFFQFMLILHKQSNLLICY